MKYAVYHVAPGQDPKAGGVCKIGYTSVYVLSEDEVFSVYRYIWDQKAGLIKTINLIKKKVEVYLKKDPLRQEWKDGKTVSVIRMMLAALKQTVSETINLPQFAAEVVPDWRRHISLGQKEVKKLILDFVGPNGEAYPSCRCPGGRITNLVVDSVEKQVAFDNDEVMSLPPTACLKPFVLRANEWHLTTLDPGTPIGDLIPRLEYKWDDIQALPENILSRIVDDVLTASAHEHLGYTFIESSILPENLRCHEVFGGIVRNIAEVLPDKRKTQLVDGSQLCGRLGMVEFNFTESRFKRFQASR